MSIALHFHSALAAWVQAAASIAALAVAIGLHYSSIQEIQKQRAKERKEDRENEIQEKTLMLASLCEAAWYAGKNLISLLDDPEYFDGMQQMYQVDRHAIPHLDDAEWLLERIKGLPYSDVPRKSVLAHANLCRDFDALYASTLATLDGGANGINVDAAETVPHMRSLLDSIQETWNIQLKRAGKAPTSGTRKAQSGANG